MTLGLVTAEDCSTIHNRGMRKSERRACENAKKLNVENIIKRRLKTVCEIGQRRAYVDPELGIIRIKNILYAKILNGWFFRFDKNDKMEFDIAECHCFDENGNNERTYMIPKDSIIEYNFRIYRNTKGEKWYDKYRVNEKVT